MPNNKDIFWMELAINESLKAFSKNEVPVGAVLVSDENLLISKAHNEVISKCDPTGHAEINAIRIGCKKTNNYRLPGSTLYVTLEPCLMCISSIAEARIKKVVFGAYERSGNTCINDKKLLSYSASRNSLKIYGGVLEKRCAEVLKKFFRNLRD